MAAPRLSVIVPTFNRAGYLQRCLRSVLDLRLPDLEAVVVDDGSTDETRQIVEGFGRPVRYVWQQNRGPAAARNLGFAASTGRYVAFLDDDDQWLPGKTAALVDVLERRQEVPFLFADTCHGNPEQGYRSFIHTYGGAGFRDIPAQEIEPFLLCLDRRSFFRQLATRNVVFLASLVLRREVFANMGGFDEGLRGAADWELFLRLAARHQFVFWNGGPASVYMTHPGSMSTDSEHMATEFISALSSLLRKEALHPADRLFAEERLARHLFNWAYRAYDCGQLATARARFYDCAQRCRKPVKPLAFWLASHFPPPVVARARAWKRTLAGCFAPTGSADARRRR